MTGLSACAWCGRVVDDRRVVLKVWTRQGSYMVPFCDKVCSTASESHLDERIMTEIRM